jgi:DNA repair exonuclease SbcCD nuclease subunit
MATELKFLHTSDWHLDQPMTGLSTIPAHLKPVLANAPWQAAESFFDLAISEKVDFILLAGDLVDLEQGGPRCAAFLLAQFERLHARGITVYWCGGSVDHPDRWPAVIQLPENVVVFPSTMVEQAVHQRNGKRLATICGAGYDSRKRNPLDFRCDADSPFPIALLHGEIDTASLSAQHIRYWALGGRHKRSVIDKTPSLAVYPGTPQSRGPGESGGHSCSMVAVDESGRVKTTEFEIDSARWNLQRLSIAENAGLDDLKSALADRCSMLRAEHGSILTLLDWKIEPAGTFNARLRNSQWQTDLLAWLRTEYGQSDHGLWSASLVFDPPAALPGEWYEEDTILGDYLRSIARYQGDSTMSLSLNDYLDDLTEEDPLHGLLSRISAREREQILGRSVLLGVEYLSRGEHVETT